MQYWCWCWLLLGSCAGPALAQVPVLRGLVLDAETRQPIPNAQVGVGDNQIGTSTNLDGRFALPVPVRYQRTGLEIALLGYQPHRQLLPPLPGPELRILLRPQPTQLGEVTVSGSVLGIVREAVARIPQNYPVRPTRLEGFFRESDNELADGKYRYLGEAVLTVFKAPYTQPQDDGEIVIRQARKVDLQKGIQRLGWYAGPFIPHRFDFVHNRLAFINEAHFKDYTYKLAELTTYHDRPVYVITFGPPPAGTRADFEGRMYIDQASYAFLAAEWHRTPAGINREFINFDSEERAYRVDYQQYAGRWHLKNVWYLTRGKPAVGGVRVRHLSEFLTTAVDTATGSPPAYTERAQFRDVFLQNTVRYDSAFWQHFATLLPPEELRRALQDRERQQQAEQLFTPQAVERRQKAVETRRLLQRLRIGWAGGLLPLASTAADVQLAFAPAGTGFQALALRRLPTQGVVGWRGLSYQFDLTRQLSVQYLNRLVFGSFRGAGEEAGATYELNLRPRHRPLFVRAGLAYCWQRVRYDLGTFANADRSLRLDGTRLGADKVSVALQQNTAAWQPQLGLGLELQHHLELVANVGYLLPTRTRTELHLAEESGFFLFRSSADVLLPPGGSTVLINNAPADTPWKLNRALLTVALLVRLR